MKQKFTFKKDKLPSGRYRSFDLARQTYIRLNGKECGMFAYDESFGDKTVVFIRFKIKREVTPEWSCRWEWTTLEHKPESEKEAREYVNNNIDRILSSFDLYLEE